MRTRFPPPPQSCMPPRTVNCTPTLQSGKAPSLRRMFFTSFSDHLNSIALKTYQNYDYDSNYIKYNIITIQTIHHYIIQMLGCFNLSFPSVLFQVSKGRSVKTTEALGMSTLPFTVNSNSTSVGRINGRKVVKMPVQGALAAPPMS